MTSDERKLASASLIPLDIDPTSVLALSRGIIFDTIVHNIEQTLSNRGNDSLPWKLTGMSLICDSNRTKRFAQKLQKMQCVPTVICTEIYHSKLVITDAGTMSTPGRKIIIPTVPKKRLTGIIIARSLDDLLRMEAKGNAAAHFVQYKLLSYGRIPTREIINGPRIPTINEKILKTVFDFELTQNNGFPRQLLPVAIISFARQDNADLCSSIRNFLSMEEHKTFDKSYLVTSASLEFSRLREEQERREDEEAESDSFWEKLQIRPPLAELSKRSADIENVHSSATSELSARVPPIKIKLVQPEKTIPSCPPLDPTFYCLLELEKVDLSLFDVSNIPDEPPVTENHSPPINVPVPTTAPKQKLDNRKSLKRLNSTEKKRKSSADRNSKKRNSNSLSSDISMLSNSRSSSISITTKGKTSKSSKNPNDIIRPDLPEEYRCSVHLTRIDLSLYDLDISSTLTPLSQSQTIENRCENDVRTNENRQESILNDDVLSLEPMTTDDGLLPMIDDVLTEVMRETASALAEENDLPTISIDELLSSVDNETDVSLIVNQSENHCEIESNTSRASADISISPGLPTLEDDPVLNSTNESPAMVNNEDCMIIVQCSDDEDYGEDEELMKRNRMNSLEDETERKTFSNSPRDTSEKIHSDPIQIDEKANQVRALSQHRSSVSSSCSSVSMNSFHSTSPTISLCLIEILLPKSIKNKKQTLKSHPKLLSKRKNLLIPLSNTESIIDPRLTYRLRSITTDLEWPRPCVQCSVVPNSPSLFSSPIQTLPNEQQCVTDFIDPRRQSLTNAILNSLFDRLQTFVNSSTAASSIEMHTVLFEETIFNTNCSLHLEYLLHKIKTINDNELRQLIRDNDEFQLSSNLLRMIFN